MYVLPCGVISYNNNETRRNRVLFEWINLDLNWLIFSSLLHALPAWTSLLSHSSAKLVGMVNLLLKRF